VWACVAVGVRRAKGPGLVAYELVVAKARQLGTRPSRGPASLSLSMPRRGSPARVSRPATFGGWPAWLSPDSGDLVSHVGTGLMRAG